jgi:hypothetical protein
LLIAFACVCLCVCIVASGKRQLMAKAQISKCEHIYMLISSFFVFAFPLSSCLFELKKHQQGLGLDFYSLSCLAFFHSVCYGVIIMFIGHMCPMGKMEHVQLCSYVWEKN